MSSVEDLLVSLGGFGKFQVLFLVSVGVHMLANGWSMLQMSYAGFIPEWFCETVHPMYENNQTIKHHLASTKEACSVNNTWTLNKELTCRDFRFDSSAVTIITEWNLVCDLKWIKSATTSVQMAGVFIGAFVAGYLADRFGRKKTLYGCALFHAVLNIVTAFSVSWQMFAVCRFFIGIGTGGMFVAVMPYQVEFMPLKWRPLQGVIPTWFLGVCLFALFSYFLANWVHLHIACGVFGLVSLIGYTYLPESLRWLIVQGRLKEAEAVCKKVAYINGTKLPSNVEFLLQKVYKRGLEEHEKAKNYTYLDIFKGWKILKITLTFSFFWFTMSLNYYGMVFGVSSLAGNLYLNIFLLAVVEVTIAVYPFYVLCMMRRIPFLTQPILELVRVVKEEMEGRKEGIFGRRWTVIGYLGISFGSALACVVTQLKGPSGSKGEIIMGLNLVTKMCLFAAWMVIMTWGLELYPTVTRNLGAGITNGAARIGGVLAPFVIDFDHRLAASYTIIAMLNLVCVILCFVTPDTKDQLLTDTMGTSTDKNDNSDQKLSYMVESPTGKNDNSGEELS